MKTAILCVVACLTASVAPAQGLGDAARKEQAKRKKTTESGANAPATYGNAELAGAGGGKGTFSANVADTSGDWKEQAPVAGEAVSTSPAGAADEGRAAEGSEPSQQTDMDRYKEKLARYRGAFQPLKARADALEREIADLAAKVARSSGVGGAGEVPIRDAYGVIVGYKGGGGGGPRPLHEVEAAQERLPKAREELARAKQQLESIEQQARRDGLAPGLLY